MIVSRGLGIDRNNISSIIGWGLAINPMEEIELAGPPNLLMGFRYPERQRQDEIAVLIALMMRD